MHSSTRSESAAVNGHRLSHAGTPPGAAEPGNGGRSGRSGAALSRRERVVLIELAYGKSTDEIAEKLFVSPHTIRTHVKNVMRKLDARTRAHAVAIGMREGLIDAP
jgi:DNA-binding CsgD family transcriptional regulator